MLLNLRLSFEVMDNISTRKPEIPDPEDIIDDLEEERQRNLGRIKEMNGLDEERRKHKIERIGRCIKEIKYLVDENKWEDFARKVKRRDYEIPTEISREKENNRPDLSEYELP